MAKIYIGCSGYNYHHWRDGVFYPRKLNQKEEFNYYASVFDTVEINSTFYGIPPVDTWLKWRDRAPRNFIYAIKANRYITHRNHLETWDKLYVGAKHLDQHLGPFLFQLPPNINKDLKRLENFAKVQPVTTRFAFEFRNESWNSFDVFDYLKQHNWAYVTVSHPTLPSIFEVSADFIYLRFHGSTSLYSSDYSNEELNQFAQIIRKYLERDLTVYAYFNNDTSGFAPKNALKLKELLS